MLGEAVTHRSGDRVGVVRYGGMKINRLELTRDRRLTHPKSWEAQPARDLNPWLMAKVG